MQAARKRYAAQLNGSDPIERCRNGLQMLFREMQVKRGRRQVFMSEHHLQRLQFDARFKLVGRVAVA